MKHIPEMGKVSYMQLARPLGRYILLVCAVAHQIATGKSSMQLHQRVKCHSNTEGTLLHYYSDNN